MDHLEARITTLRQHISLLRQEEHRLNQVRYSPTTNAVDRATYEADLRTVSQKIISVERELRRVENGLMKR